MRTKIIYEDNYVLVCYKPAGLATQSGRIGQPDMVSELKNYLASKETGNRKVPYLGVVHRLDQPVEGLLVFAKDAKTAAKLTGQLAKGSLNKQYYAKVCGKVMPEEGELVDYLVKEGNAARVVDAGQKDAKKALLQYRTVSSTKAGGDNVTTLLHIHIDTGRFHQIRVQLSHAGWPILGDAKYGTQASAEQSKKCGIHNVALYAYCVEFDHPVTGKHHLYEYEVREESAE